MEYWSIGRKVGNLITTLQYSTTPVLHELYTPGHQVIPSLLFNCS